jgi:hypothetical protein
MYTESLIVHIAECLAQRRSVRNDDSPALPRIVRELRTLVAAVTLPTSRFEPRTSKPSIPAPARR